jgi:hypothetical protein
VRRGGAPARCARNSRRKRDALNLLTHPPRVQTGFARLKATDRQGAHSCTRGAPCVERVVDARCRRHHRREGVLVERHHGGRGPLPLPAAAQLSCPTWKVLETDIQVNGEGCMHRSMMLRTMCTQSHPARMRGGSGTQRCGGGLQYTAPQTNEQSNQSAASLRSPSCPNTIPLPTVGARPARCP